MATKAQVAVLKGCMRTVATARESRLPPLIHLNHLQGMHKPLAGSCLEYKFELLLLLKGSTSRARGRSNVIASLVQLRYSSLATLILRQSGDTAHARSAVVSMFRCSVNISIACASHVLLWVKIFGRSPLKVVLKTFTQIPSIDLLETSRRVVHVTKSG